MAFTRIKDFSAILRELTLAVFEGKPFGDFAKKIAKKMKREKEVRQIV